MATILYVIKIEKPEENGKVWEGYLGDETILIGPNRRFRTVEPAKVVLGTGLVMFFSVEKARRVLAEVKQAAEQHHPGHLVKFFVEGKRFNDDMVNELVNKKYTFKCEMQ